MTGMTDQNTDNEPEIKHEEQNMIEMEITFLLTNWQSVISKLKTKISKISVKHTKYKQIQHLSSCWMVGLFYFHFVAGIIIFSGPSKLNPSCTPRFGLKAPTLSPSDWVKVQSIEYWKWPGCSFCWLQRLHCSASVEQCHPLWLHPQQNNQPVV